MQIALQFNHQIVAHPYYNSILISQPNTTNVWSWNLVWYRFEWFIIMPGMPGPAGAAGRSLWLGERAGLGWASSGYSSALQLVGQQCRGWWVLFNRFKSRGDFIEIHWFHLLLIRRLMVWGFNVFLMIVVNSIGWIRDLGPILSSTLFYVVL